MNIIKKLNLKLKYEYDVKKNNIKKIMYFGLKYFFYYKNAKKVYYKNREKGLKYFEQRYFLTKKYIENRFKKYFIFSRQPAVALINPSCKVWVFWWQGEKMAPDLVRQCISSIRENAEHHEVVVIDQDNYKKYVKIDKKILDNLEKKRISYTHLSDLIRCRLLAKYGGIWCDSTIFMSNKFDKKIFKYSFYTIKHDFKYIPELEIEPSHCRWRSFFLASVPNNPLFEITANVLNDWLASSIPLIDYFTIDYIIWILYDKNPIIKKMIDDVPINNNGPYRLALKLNDEYDEELWKDISKENYLHKLNYRITVFENKENFYYKIVKKF